MSFSSRLLRESCVSRGDNGADGLLITRRSISEFFNAIDQYCSRKFPPTSGGDRLAAAAVDALGSAASDHSNSNYGHADAKQRQRWGLGYILLHGDVVLEELKIDERRIAAAGVGGAKKPVFATVTKGPPALAASCDSKASTPGCV
jgi:hypothetical protein